MNAETLVNIYQQLKSERTNIEGMWSFVDSYVLPYRVDLYRTTTTEGTIDWTNRKVYDNTASISCETLASRIQSSLISPSSRWFDLQFSDEELNKNGDAKKWIESVADIIFQTLQSSNFNLEASEAILDLVAFGTMSLMEEVNKKGEIIFTAAPINDVYFEMGATSNVSRFYRRLNWTGLKIKDKFGDEIPQEIVDLIDEEKPNVKHEVLFCVYEIPENSNADTSKTLAVNARPFGYKYIFVKNKMTIKQGGYYEQPSFVTRWRVTTGSEFGNAPAFSCMGTILDLNEIMQLLIEEGALNIEPPLMTTYKGVLSDLDRSRGGLTVVSDMNELAALPGRGDANLGVIEVQVMQDEVRRAFFEDKLNLKESPAMTATEVNVRRDLMNSVLGPTMSRLKNEFLDPLLMRTFAILYRQGRLPEAPQVVKDAQAEYDISYLGPLPRAQKQEVAKSIAGYIGQLASLAETYREAKDVLKIDESLIALGEYSGVPAYLLNSIEDIEKLRADRLKAEAERDKPEVMRQQGEAMKALGEGAQAAESIDGNSIEALQSAIGRV